jgi:hypothetical protein
VTRPIRPPPPNAPDLKDRVLAAARLRTAPTRPEVRRRQAWRVAQAAAAMAAVLSIAGGPAHASGRPEAVGSWILVGMAALALAASRLALPPRGSMLPPPAWRLAAIAIGVPVVVAAWLIAWHTAYDDPFTRFGLRCFAFTAAAAPMPFVALLAFAPGFAPVRPRLVGAALGAAAGAWATVVVELWCPLADPAHVLVGHALPLVVLAAAGALAGGRLLRPRPA